MADRVKTTTNTVLTPSKAKKILRDRQVRGKALTAKQKGFFGARAGGAPVMRQLSALKRKMNG